MYTYLYVSFIYAFTLLNWLVTQCCEKAGKVDTVNTETSYVKIVILIITWTDCGFWVIRQWSVWWVDQDSIHITHSGMSQCLWVDYANLIWNETDQNPYRGRTIKKNLVYINYCFCGYYTCISGIYTPIEIIENTKYLHVHVYHVLVDRWRYAIFDERNIADD